VATIAFYGPTDKKATKVVACIIVREGAEPGSMRKWYSENDVRTDENMLEEILEFVTKADALSVAMIDRIIGCPHEEGIDYPEGQDCPQCSFWKDRDRWTGDFLC